MLPFVCIGQRHYRDLHVGVLPFGNREPMMEFFEGRQVQIHGQRIAGPVNTGNVPAPTGTPREDGDFARITYEATGFIPTRGCIAENLQHRWRKRFEEFRAIGVMNDSAGEDERGGELMSGGSRSRVFFW